MKGGTFVHPEVAGILIALVTLALDDLGGLVAVVNIDGREAGDPAGRQYMLAS